MKIKHITITLILMSLTVTPLYSQGKAGAIKGLLKIISKNKKNIGIGAGAVAAPKALSLLKRGEAIYSIHLDGDENSSAFKWADTMSGPDVYIVLNTSTKGSFIIPSIIHNYKGQILLGNVRMPKIPANEKITIDVYDDDGTANSIWNSISSTKVDVTADLGKVHPALPIKLKLKEVSLLKGGKVTLDSNDFICQAVTTTEKGGFFNGKWKKVLDLKSSKKVKVGTVIITQTLYR